MIGGTMKTTSLLALAAAASVLATSASAADLGGNCCADLEERIAELEATTARKGNRKVSLEVSGWVHSAVMWFDGAALNNNPGTLSKESNTYVVNRPESNSRFRFVGKAAISPKMNAGYLMEIQVNTANADNVTAGNDDSPGNSLAVRHSAWWIEHKDFGKVWVGQTSQATDGITEIQLSNTGHFANSNSTAGGALLAVTNSPVNLSLFNFMGGTGTDNSQIGEGNRRNLVKYESPTFAGFAFSAAAGEDDFWDIALRYAGEHHGFKLAFGIGYEQTTEGSLSGNSERNCLINTATPSSEVKCQQLGLSGSIMHVATGLFINGHYGWRQDDKVPAGFEDTSTRWGIMGGIEKNFFGMGKTTLFGEYAQFDVGVTNTFNGSVAGPTNVNGAVAGEASYWGIGVNQNIESAAMDLYIQYRSWGDLSTTDANGVVSSYDGIRMIYAGGKINF